MKNIKKLIFEIYRKTANLNLYASICNAKKERLLKEICDIKIILENLEYELKK